MCLELNKEYNLAVKYENKFINVGTIKKYLYDNEIFYLVKQYGKFDTCYNQNEINEFLKINIMLKFKGEIKNDKRICFSR